MTVVPGAPEFTAESKYDRFWPLNCLENRCGVTPQSVPGNLSKMAPRGDNDYYLIKCMIVGTTWGKRLVETCLMAVASRRLTTVVHFSKSIRFVLNLDPWFRLNMTYLSVVAAFTTAPIVLKSKTSFSYFIVPYLHRSVIIQSRIL